MPQILGMSEKVVVGERFDSARSIYSSIAGHLRGELS